MGGWVCHVIVVSFLGELEQIQTLLSIIDNKGPRDKKCLYFL